MKVNEQKISKFIATSETVFAIPVYQRNYDWGESHCKRLLDDIITAGRNNPTGGHFIGSIVYIHDGVYSTAGLAELMIIDGQQRLTTLTLIYAALYRHALNSGQSFVANRIFETYLINKHASENTPDTEKLKLKPTENNKESLRCVLENRTDDYPEDSKIITNYKFFKDRINDENFEDILKGIDQLIFVEISLESKKDNPQRIFESLNSTGLALSPADLIRNYILMDLPQKDQEKMYTTYWEVIEKNTRDKHQKESRVSDFIRDYLTLKNKEIPTKSKVYDEFKEKHPTMEPAELEGFLSEMTSLSKCYGKLLNPPTETDRTISKHLVYIKQLEINVAYPFLMRVYADYAGYTETKIDRDTFIAVLELIQSYIMRRFIVGLQSNALNKIFKGLYEKVDPKNYLYSIQKSLLERSGTGRFPQNSEVETALKVKDVYRINTQNRAYLLQRLENHDNNEPVLIAGNPDITIEHIFPQTPDPAWKDELSPEEYSFIEENYLHTIGNLTLSGNNGSLGNKSFLEKRDMKNVAGKEQGYSYSRLWLNRDLREKDRWDRSEIEARTKRLTERFLSVWEMPAVVGNAMSENVEVNIFDAGDPTYKQLEYAVFFDEKLTVRDFADLLDQVLKKLFEMHPEAFYKPSFQKKIGFVSSPIVGYSYVRLNDSYFVKKKLSNLDKFRLLKYILKEFEYEDELIIKYV